LQVLKCALDKVLLVVAGQSPIPSTIFAPGDEENFDIALQKKTAEAAQARKEKGLSVATVGVLAD